MFAGRFASTRGRLAVAATVGMSTTVSSLALCNGDAKKDVKNQRIVIVGGGTAGIGVAAMLTNAGMKNVTIIDPAEKHFYQPYWTLVGAGLKHNFDSQKDMRDCIPRGVTWLKKSVTTFQPEQNKVSLADGSTVDYDYLVVAAGIQIDWDKIPGLKEGLEKEDSGVVSIYDYKFSEKTHRTYQELKNSAKRMLFTMSPTLIKCAGAPQKIMWLLEDTLREDKLRDKVSVEFWTPGGGMFGIKKYSDQLEVIRKERGVVGEFRQQLVSIDVANKIATFKHLDTGVESQQQFDLLHVCPHMSSPAFLKASPLANADGWVEVDKHSLQSTKFRNIFGIGDCTNTPNSKTAAAITSQAPVLVHNLTRLIHNNVNNDNLPLDGKYKGYASCPLIVAKNRVILAEFGYDGKIMESFNPEYGKFPMTLLGQDGALQQRFFYWLKEQFFPFAYWKMWIHGYWYGTNGPFKPDVTEK